MRASSVSRRSNQDISTALLDESKPEGTDGGQTGSGANGIAFLVLSGSRKLLKVSVECVLLSCSGLLGVVSDLDSGFFLKSCEAGRRGHGSTHTLSYNQDISGVDHGRVINVYDAIRDDRVPYSVATVGHVCRDVDSFLLFCSSGVHLDGAFDEIQEFDVSSSERLITMTVDDLVVSCKHDCHPGEFRGREGEDASHRVISIFVGEHGLIQSRNVGGHTHVVFSITEVRKIFGRDLTALLLGEGHEFAGELFTTE